MFNTKAPIMDWSPFMRRDFSKENSMGALADALKVVADTADGYGATADKKLLSGLVNETDTSKIPTQDFYSQDNALKAKNLVEQNKSVVFQNEQRDRTKDLNARDDATYALSQFNKDVAGDAINMDRNSFNQKYANAGGVDWAMAQGIYDKKDEKAQNLEDRKIKNNLTNLQIQNAQNSIDIQNQDKVDKSTASEILSKYKSWDEFKNSEDYNNPKYTYNAKKLVYDSKIGGNTVKDISITDQIKLEEISNNKKDLPRVQEEYKKNYGVDMPVSEQSKFIYQGKLPEKMTESNDKSQIKEKTDKELRTIITGLQDLKKWGNSYKSEFSGPIDAVTGAIGDLVGGQVSDGESAFRSQRESIIGPATKAVYGGNASNADRENINNMLPNFRDGEATWKEKQKTVFIKGLENFKTNIDVLKANGFDTSAYEDEYNKLLDNTKTNNNPVITSVRKKENITPSSNPKILTPDEIVQHGIKFN